MSLQYYPHEDMHVKAAVRPDMHSGGLEAGAGDYFAITVINLTLVMALVSFALDGGLIGTLVAFGLIAGFNGLVLRGVVSSRRNHPTGAARARLSRRIRASTAGPSP